MLTTPVSYGGRVGDLTTLVSGVMLDTWPRAAVASGVVLSQTPVVALPGLTGARLRDARFGADGMFDAFVLLQYILNAFTVLQQSDERQKIQNIPFISKSTTQSVTIFCSYVTVEIFDSLI